MIASNLKQSRISQDAAILKSEKYFHLSIKHFYQYFDDLSLKSIIKSQMIDGQGNDKLIKQYSELD